MPLQPDAASTGERGLTLVELLIMATIFAIAIAALLGAHMGQVVLNEHARNVTWAVNDASRVMEELRKQNSGAGCVLGVNPPAGFASWDAWLASTAANGGGGKSVPPDPANNERVVVSAPGAADPLSVTVAVCWRHRGRIIGECVANGAALIESDGSNGFAADGVIRSIAMLTTTMTCR